MSEKVVFDLGEAEFIPLDKLLKATGVCASGGQARSMVSQGEVRVDGTVELRKRAKIRAGQSVDTGTSKIDVTR